MESSSSNSEEIELQQMQLDERELHQKCLPGFKKLKIHLEYLKSSFNFINPIPFEIAFRIFFREEHQAFREKMYHNLNQLQWKHERENFHGHDSNTCLVVLRTQFKEFFDSKEQQESLVIEGTTLEACLVTEGAVMEACFVSEGASLEACLVNEDITLND
ncbi:hypothetical protein Tco_1514998 [Tanacetum coccineum]